MKQLYRKLKEHPGTGHAAILTGCGFLAGMSNESFSTWWKGGLFGMTIMGIFSWGIIYLSIKSKQK